MHHTLEAFKNEPSYASADSRRKRSVAKRKPIIYPDSDGKPMSDNTKQFDWIVKIKEGLEILFADDPDVFVAGDLLWYPVRNNNKIRIAPDALAAFGRPKGYRGSYRQWLEGDVVPQVVFEVLSPGNTRSEMRDKLEFYEQYGVEEYYLYDPYKVIFKGWLRSDGRLRPIDETQGWKSPRLGTRFEIISDGKERELVIFRPDGRRFLSPTEIEKRADRAESEAEKQRQRAESERQRAEKERQRAEMLEAKLRALGIEL